VYIVLGTCIGPVWRPQHWAVYAASPAWKEGRNEGRMFDHWRISGSFLRISGTSFSISEQNLLGKSCTQPTYSQK